MKALLIQPVPPRTHWPRGSFLSRWVPTGLAYLAAALRRRGHEARVHNREEQLIKDGFDWDRADARLRALLTEFRPDLVGLSVTTPYVPETEATAALAKELCGPQTLVVAGGPHVTALPERTLADCPHVDVAVIGEGEHTLAELAERGVRGDVAGICFRPSAGSGPPEPGDGRSAGQAIRTAPRPLERDLDSLGPMPYDLFDMEHYTARDRWMTRWLPLRATNLRSGRGCSNACRFCAGHLVNGVGVRFHSTDYVVSQLRLVVERFGVEGVHFEDDTLGASRAYLLELCEAICRADLARKVRWHGCLRANQADPELLRAMKAAGCFQVEFGFESGSDRMLRSLGKHSTVEMNLRAARLAREAGLRLFANVMFGLPGETEADAWATVRFLRQTRPDIISFARMYPLPGTAVYETIPEAEREALQWADYAFLDSPDFPINVTAMGREEFARLYRRIDKYCLRPALTWQLLRDTPRSDRLRRRALARRLLRFCLLHPLRALRVPW